MTPELNRPEVASQYDVIINNDPVVHTGGYSGKLSNINLAGAESLVKSKLPYLAKKQSSTPIPPAIAPEPALFSNGDGNDQVKKPVRNSKSASPVDEAK